MHDLDRTQVGLGSDSFESESGGSVFDEEEQMNLAAEMMEVNSEEEFENFLGDLISKGVHALGGFIGSPVGKALGGVLKGAAGQLLPVAGQALGLGEAEMEEQEWEAANKFVKVAGDAVKNAASAPPGAHPDAVATKAVVEAAKVHAPELVPAVAGGRSHADHGPGRRSSGRWVRHGHRIILHGV